MQVLFESVTPRQTEFSGPSLTAWTAAAVHFFLTEPRKAHCCGRMSAWFVNRHGRTLCWTCDDERQMAQRRAA
jgi:hypothetical protein